MFNLYSKERQSFNSRKRGLSRMITNRSTVGFIGTGVMGGSMAEHILNAGYPVHIFTRTKDKAMPLLNKGAEWQPSIKALAKQADIIVTMVGYPADVEHVYFGEDGLLNHVQPGTYLIDMTTSKPALAIRIYEEASKRDCYAIDAPVSGGDIGAQKGTLSIMAGGEPSTFDAVLPLFKLMGTNIIHQGGPGAGQHTKLCNQITIASNMIGVCEAIVYAQKAGLNPSRVLDSITTGAAGSWSLSNLAPRMIKGDFAPGFYVKHFIKDMTIAIESAQEMGLSTPGLDLSLKLYKELADKGEENSGTQALIKLFIR
nr:NAD(P)-dependent oxidoreductase [Lentibacillus saliphilus]